LQGVAGELLKRLAPALEPLEQSFDQASLAAALGAAGLGRVRVERLDVMRTLESHPPMPRGAAVCRSARSSRAERPRQPLRHGLRPSDWPHRHATAPGLYLRAVACSLRTSKHQERG
jgi:hypothetical protein